MFKIKRHFSINLKHLKNNMRKSAKQVWGFTLIEVIVTTVIVAVLATMVLLLITQYFNKSKDSNIRGNLVVLISAAEKYYDINTGQGYTDFCDSAVVSNAEDQLPTGSELICEEAQDGNSWAACVQEFTDTRMAFCVDSRGVKRQICNTSCQPSITQCPADVLENCAL